MKFLEWLKMFLTKNTMLLKSIRTLIEVCFAIIITVATNALAGGSIPIELQAAMIGVLSAFLSAVLAEIGELIPKEG